MTWLRRGRLRGQSLTEFAVALPVLLLLVCGILDLGRAFYAAVTVTDAARDGARTLITNTGGYGPGKEAGYAAAQAAASNLNGGVAVTITCPDTGNACVGDPTGPVHDQPVTVDVSYRFQPLTPLFSSLGVITLHGHAVMDASW